MTNNINITKYLYDLAVTSGISPGNGNTLRVLSELDNPHTRYDTVHIAGTNGKGSTTVMLATALSSDKKVGCYTSPHLVKYNERITIYSGDTVSYITDDELYSYLNAIELLVQKLDISLTEFEILTVTAFWYFHDMQVDMACIEVGLGGRYDTTNVITPILSIITNIGLDHTDRLGKTIPEIAADKAGIIKAGVPVITGAGGDAMEIIRNEAIEQNAPLYRAVYADIAGEFDNVVSYYQRGNLAIVIAAIDILAVKYGLAKDRLISNLSKFRWPGRYEHIQTGDNTLILDGAHNPDGMGLLLDSLRHDYPNKPISFVLGFLADKEWQGMVDMIAGYPNLKNIYVSDIEYYRGLNGSIISDYLGTQHRVQATRAKKISEIAGNEDILCVCGSLYLVGQAKQAL